MPPATTLERPLHMTAQDADATKALLVSYPKSGRTWLRYLFRLAAVDCYLTHAGFGSSPRNPNFGRPFGSVTGFGEIDRAILLIRNPIDTAVSLYFQIHSRELQGLANRLLYLPGPALTGRLPPRELVDFLRHPGFGVRKVCAFNRAWMDAVENDPRFVVVGYEELQTAPELGFRTILTHLAPDRSFDYSALAEATSFSNMQKLEATTQDRTLKLGARPNESRSRKVRRGKAKGYVDYLAPEICRELEAVSEEYGFPTR